MANSADLDERASSGALSSGSTLFAKTPYEGKIYILIIHCGENYPHERPIVRFLTKLRLNGVKDDGEVDYRHLDELKHWNKNSNIKTLLTGVRRLMSLKENQKLPQPPDTATFS